MIIINILYKNVIARFGKTEGPNTYQKEAGKIEK